MKQTLAQASLFVIGLQMILMYAQQENTDLDKASHFGCTLEFPVITS